MNILVVNGYPGKNGLSCSIALEYVKKYSKKHNVKLIDVYSLKFDFILHEGYKGKNKLEEDLVKAQEDIKWADKIIFVFPIWWGTMPSLLRSFLEKTLSPGFAFKYVKGKLVKLLRGKKAELIATAGGPKWYYRTLGRVDQRRTLGKNLRFCGISLGKIKVYGGIKANTSKKYIEKIMNSV
jgi:NAD(P)H dehydrogenase (quinone)